MIEHISFVPSRIKEIVAKGDLVRSISIRTEFGFLRVTGKFMPEPLKQGFENSEPIFVQYQSTFSGDPESVLPVVMSLRMKILGFPNPDVGVNHAIMQGNNSVRYQDEDFERPLALSDQELVDRRQKSRNDFQTFYEQLEQSPDGVIITDGWSNYRFVLTHRKDKVAVAITCLDDKTDDEADNGLSEVRLGVNYYIWSRDTNLRIDPIFCDNYDVTQRGESVVVENIY